MCISSKISFTGEKKNITVLQISGYNKIRVDHHNLKVTWKRSEIEIFFSWTMYSVARFKQEHDSKYTSKFKSSKLNVLWQFIEI